MTRSTGNPFRRRWVREEERRVERRRASFNRDVTRMTLPRA
jgi:hypothetical protein